MKFMNSNYGYADFKKRITLDTRTGNITSREITRSKDVVPAFGKPKSRKALAGTFAPPQIREPGMGRNARSTAAGASQGSRNLFKTQGRNGVKAKSTVAGLKQSGRDAAYAGGQMLKKAGRFAKNNKVGVGLAAAGALGGVGYGVYRKMRSDKGKKRGSNNN